MTSSLLHLVGLRPRVCYTLTNFRRGGNPPLNTPMYYIIKPECGSFFPERAIVEGGGEAGNCLGGGVGVYVRRSKRLGGRDNIRTPEKTME